MFTWKRGLISAVVLGILIVGGYYFTVHVYQNETLREITAENRLLGALLFSVIMFGTTVVAPLTSLPLVPVIAPFLGPFVTGVACFVGWSLGAVVAFCIGRYFGQPVVSRFVRIESIKKYERYLKPETTFALIVTLHMFLPVDIMSYAFGMLTSVSVRMYTIATMLGIFWFSFAFAYAGDALVNGNYVLLSSIGVASVLILYFSWSYAQRTLIQRDDRIDTIQE